MSMALAARPRERLKGIAEPRIAPPEPLRHLERQFVATAKEIGIRLYPWQRVAARYLTALRADGRWLYPEVAIIVARQNGKTELLKPLIYSGLMRGERIMHSAQNRELPREVFGQVADIFDEQESLFALRNGRPRRPRYANGQEEIRLAAGGLYRIVAPTRSGARGPSNDRLIVDELREMWDHEFMDAAKPTLTASDNRQTVYLSNAGTEESAVLRGLQERAGEDPNLAYLEWSADQALADDDLEGWRQANPSMGHRAGVREYLEDEHLAARLAGTMPSFETEHLCRGVVSMTASLVTEAAWLGGRTNELADPVRPAMGIAVHPGGTRVSAVIAWRQADGSYALHPVLEMQSEQAIDLDAVGLQLRRDAQRRRVRSFAFSGISDVALSRYLPRAKAVDGRLFANASDTFANLVGSGQVRWVQGDTIGDDLKHVIRRPSADGSAVATSNGERPVTAALAAIRALWLASAPREVPRIG